MLNKFVGIFVVGLVSLSLQQRESKLSDLIPTDAWKKTGLSKLSDSEQTALRDEILALLKRYHRSLTEGVAVIAPSISTSAKAREILAETKIKQIPFRYAEKILVVVRSALFNPLQATYDSVGELQGDSDRQLNIAGPKFHVYVYSMDDDLKVTQVSHKSLDAD